MQALRILVLLALSYSATAEAASYVRIWRGHQKPGLSDEAFVRGMNHSLLPATGELALTQAKLEVYMPVLLPAQRAAALPAEVALLSYESEDGYRAYRATAEGIHYGDMHWDLFDKATSGSLVPAPYAGNVAFEQAYAVVPALDPSWSTGQASFRVLERAEATTDEQFLAEVKARIEAVKAHAPLTYYVLVANTYAMEYVTAQASLPASRTQIALPGGSRLTTGTGVRYTIGNDRAEGGVRATWDHHIAAWNARDLDALLADYHEGSVVIRNDEIYRGLAEIRVLFKDLFARFDLVSAASIDRIVQEGPAIYLTWRAKGKDAQGAEVSSQQGTDTFLIRDGKIDAQTITADPLFWSTLFVR